LSANFKLIALMLSFLQVYACASDGANTKRNYETYSHIERLSAVGSHARKSNNTSIAVLRQSGNFLSVEFTQTRKTGYVFLVTVKNLTGYELIIDSKNFTCRQRNSRLPQSSQAILSEKEALADYDMLINNILQDTTNWTGISVQIVKLLVVALLIVIVLKHDGGNSLTRNFFEEDNTYYGKPANSSKSQSDNTIAEKKLNTIKTVLAQKQQHSRLLFKSQTIHPGQLAAGQIFCPFNSMGNLGVSLVYRGESLDFDAIIADGN